MIVKSVKARFNKRGSKLQEDEKGKISIEVYWTAKQRIFLDTEFFVLEKEWDKDQRCVNNKHSNHLFINSKLRERIGKIESYEYGLRNNDQALTPELLMDFASRNFENHRGQSFTDFFEHQVKNRPFKTIATASHHKKTLNKLQAFKREVSFQELTVAFIENFDEFMKNQGLGLNARSNHHKNIKANLNLAATEGYIEHRKIPYVTQLGGSAGKFVVRTEPGGILYLDFEERERIENLHYNNNKTYERYRKVFLFMCYTGLRISDIENFCPKHLHKSNKGYEIDLHKMIKTRKPVYLQLYNLFEGKPQRILEEFLKDTFDTSDFDQIIENHEKERIFPEVTGQVINRELKVIANDAKIHKNVSCHVGRHTFGTQMAFLTKGNLNLVRDLMGHSKAETTMTYIRLADKMRGQLLKEVDWNAHKEVEKTSKETISEEKEKQKPKTKNTAKQPSNTEQNNSNSNAIAQIKQYISEKVFPELELPTKGKVHFYLDEDSLSQYCTKLPFKPEEYKAYKNNPIKITGYIADANYLDKVNTIEESFNNHPWVKNACIELTVMFMPVLDETKTFLI